MLLLAHLRQMLYWCISDQILFCVHLILFISQHLLAFILENAKLILNSKSSDQYKDAKIDSKYYA